MLETAQCQGMTQGLPFKLMLFVYPKSEQNDLTLEQTKILRKIVKDEFK